MTTRREDHAKAERETEELQVLKRQLKEEQELHKREKELQQEQVQ